MKKSVKKISASLVTFALILNTVSCNFNVEEMISQAGGYIEDIKNNGEILASNFNEWWGSASKDVSTWWDNASDDISVWFEEACESGKDFGKKVSEKINEIYNYLVVESEETMDKIATDIAQKIHDNATKSIGGVLPKSDRTFENKTLFDPYTEKCNYDEEAFAYKLIAATLPADFDYFPASLIDSEGESVIGLGYTNYKDAFKSDDGKILYGCGFMSLVDEKPIDVSELEKDVVVRRVDMDVADYSFFLSQLPESYKSHCVALGKYFTFGVNEGHVIEYTCVDYTPGIVNDSLGGLYSFDENKIVANGNKASYLTDSDFYSEVKYASRSVETIKQDMLKSLESFDIDLANIDIQGIFNLVKEKITSLYNNFSNNIGSLTLNDVLSVDIFSPTVPTNAQDFEKWIVGISCVLVCLLTIVIAVFIPQLRATVATIAGAVVEVLVQVVMENRSVKSLDFRKIVIAAVAGAISANMGIVGDSFVGGITDAVFALIDGQNFKTAIESLFYGMVAGLALGLTFSFLSKLLGNVINALKPDFLDNLSKKIGQNQIFFGNKTMKKVSDVDLINAGYSANKTGKYANGINSNYKTQLAANAVEQLPSVKNKGFKYYDVNGNVSTTKLTNGILGITDDADIALKNTLIDFETGKSVDKLFIKNGNIDFDSINPPTVYIDDLTSNRYNKYIDGEYVIGNFTKADQKLADLYSYNVDAMPKSIREYFISKGYVLDDTFRIDGSVIKTMRNDLSITCHEVGLTGKVQFVPIEAHSKIGHLGLIGSIKLGKLYDARDVSLKGYITIYSKVVTSN